MGRSQRHKVMEQGISSSQEVWAEGVGAVPPETTYNERGNPQNSGPKEGEVDEYHLPLAPGASGGPLQGSLVQSVYAAGGEAPHPITPPDPGPEPEPAIPPALTSLEPNTAAISDPDFTIRCLGENFDESCKIIWMGAEEPTTLVSPTEVTTGVKPSVVTSPTTIEVLIRKAVVDAPALDSQTLIFTWTEAAPPPEE